MGIWTKKPLQLLCAEAEDGECKLHRTLGATSLVMLGIGAVIGAGLFSVTGIAAAQHAGPAIAIAFVIAAIGCCFAGLCYCELASMIPISGSAYTYAYATMGELLAWIIGWDLILEYAVGAATVSISWSAYFVSLLHEYNIYPPPELLASPWQPVHFRDGSSAYGWINLPAFLIVVVLSLPLILGIRKSAWFNTVIVLVKVAVVLLFIGLGYFYIDEANYHPFIPPNQGAFGEFGWSGILRASGILFFAYIGFDAISTTVQETKNPQRNLPIGILGSLFICTVLYVAFSLVMTGLANYTQLNVAAPVAVAIHHTPYPWLIQLTKLAILAGLTSVILVMLLGQSRIFFCMARDGLLPPMFSDLHPRYRTPWKSNVILMLFVGGFGAFAPLAMVGSMTSIGTLLAFVIVCIAVLVMRRRHPEIARPFRTPWVPFVPVMGILVCLIMMMSLSMDNWLRLGVWLVLGMMIYIYYGRRHVRLKQ